MEVDLAVGEPDIGAVKKGDSVTFTVLAYPQTFSGTVSQVRQNPTVVSNVVTYDTVVIVNNKAGLLRPGMTANALIQTQSVSGAIIVPIQALEYRPSAATRSVYHLAASAGYAPAHPHGAGTVGTAAGSTAIFDVSGVTGSNFKLANGQTLTYAGVIATRDKFVRQMPGRLVGQSTDSRGQRAFCLTLATREQHIRREKATSNICTNQALVALMATVFMTVYGKQGLRELALQNLAKAHYLAGKVKPRFSGKFFNEFVCGVGDPEARNQALLEKKIVGGLPLGRFYPELADSVLLCATEMSRRADMDAVAEVLR